MKKKITLFFLTILSTVVHAQFLSFDHDTAFFYVEGTNARDTAYIKISNSDKNQVDYKWEKLENTLSNDWKVWFCDCLDCTENPTGQSLDAILTGNDCSIDPRSTTDYKMIIDFQGQNVTTAKYRFKIIEGTHEKELSYIVTPVLSVKEEVLKGLNLKVFPNPAVEFIAFDYDVKKANVINFSLYDISGKKVKERIVNASKKQILMSVEDLTNGIYSYHFLVDGELILTDKIVIQK